LLLVWAWSDDLRICILFLVSLAVERSQHRRFLWGIKQKFAFNVVCKWRGSTAFEGVGMIHQPDIYKIWRLMIGDALHDGTLQ